MKSTLPNRLIAYVWWCGDYDCDCTQAQILLRGRNEHGFDVVLATVWEGEFRTFGESGAAAELWRVRKAMRSVLPEVERTIDWQLDPWPLKEPA